MRYIEALELGKTERGMPEKVITTLVSKIFIFGQKVLKVYKHEPFFFADLLDFESRKAFYNEDFFWNNTAAPEIYLQLWGVQEKDGIFELVPPSMGEDFVIEMSRIDDTKTLTKLLVNNQLTKENTEAFVGALVDTLAVLTRGRRERLAKLFAKDLYTIMMDDIKSLRDWMMEVPDHIPAKDTETVFALLNTALEKEPYFRNAELSAAIDNNCDNLLLREGSPSFIDILSPMEEWRVVDEYATISRTIVDIEVLGAEELGGAARAAYGKYQRDLPSVARLVHELRAACIQWPYRYMIKQDELAEKFGAYSRNKMMELQKLLAQYS